jgi:hypothetical protein
MLANILYSKNEYLSISLGVLLIRLIWNLFIEKGYKQKEEKYPTFLLGLWLCSSSPVI